MNYSASLQTDFPNYPISISKTTILLVASLGGRFDLCLSFVLHVKSIIKFGHSFLWNISLTLPFWRIWFMSFSFISSPCFYPFFTFIFVLFPKKSSLFYGSLQILPLPIFAPCYLVTISVWQWPFCFIISTVFPQLNSMVCRRRKTCHIFPSFPST